MDLTEHRETIARRNDTPLADRGQLGRGGPAGDWGVTVGAPAPHSLDIGPPGCLACLAWRSRTRRPKPNPSAACRCSATGFLTDVARSLTVDWDPKVTNGLAVDHDVILFDYPGIGRSSGETPSTVAALSEHCAAFCRASGLIKVDVLGFSPGGMIAQRLGLADRSARRQRHFHLIPRGPRRNQATFNTC
jgi:alpha/beta hydrolase fold